MSCGKELPVEALTCPGCGTAKSAPLPQTPASGPGVADKIKAASADSLQAFKSFALNPVGELANVYNSLGETRALGVGITFGVVSAICFVLSVSLFFRGAHFGAGWYLKALFYACVPYVTTAAASLGARKVFRGQGPLAVDAFIAGAALLPFGFATLLAAILGRSAPGLISVLFIFAASIAVLILFFGFLRIAKLSEKACTLVVPIVLTLSGWLSNVVFNQLLK